MISSLVAHHGSWYLYNSISICSNHFHLLYNDIRVFGSNGHVFLFRGRQVWFRVSAVESADVYLCGFYVAYRTRSFFYIRLFLSLSLSLYILVM